MTSAYRKASEQHEPEDGQRQLIQPEDLLELTPVRRDGLTGPEARAITLRMAAMSGTVQRTSGPTWRHRAWIAAVVALCLPSVIAIAYIVGYIVTNMASYLGAIFLS